VTTKEGSSNLLQMPRPSRPLSRRRRALRVAALIIWAGRDATGDCLASRRSAEYGDKPHIAGAGCARDVHVQRERGHSRERRRTPQPPRRVPSHGRSRTIDSTVSADVAFGRAARTVAQGAVANSGLCRRWPARGLVLASVMSAMFLVGATQALADSASITVTNTAGQSDPAAGVPRVFTVSGTAAIPERVFVKFRAPGGAPCAPDAKEDSGETFYEYFGYSPGPFAYDEGVEGSFQTQKVFTWKAPGTKVFCIWLAKDENTITTPIPQTITFRSPTGTIGATISPSTPTPGQQATITVTGSSEAPENVYATIRPAGGASCAPTYESDSGQSLIDEKSVNGSFSVQATTTQSAAGTYLICIWLASSRNDTSPVAGPQPVTFMVGSPPPPPPPRPPVPSNSCLRDRAAVANGELLVRRYAHQLKSHHLSRRTRRKDQLALARARKSASKYESLRHHQCPNGR
jgi:hypothetical protein